MSDSLRPYGLYVARQAPLSLGFPRPEVEKTRQDSGLPWWLSGKESVCNSGDLGSIPRSGESPGEGHGNPLCILAWEIPWTEEPGGLQSMGSQRVRQDLATKPPPPGKTTLPKSLVEKGGREKAKYF